MSKNKYKEFCLDILKDTSTYLPISQTCNTPHTQSFKPLYINKSYAMLRLILSNHKFLYQDNHSNNTNNTLPHRKLTKLATSLLQLESSDRLRYSATFYILMKMHKEPPFKGRPIVNCTFTLTYHASKYISNILKPISDLINTITSSSLDTLLELDQLPLASFPSAILLCADVKSLYPSIPITYGILAVKDLLLEYGSNLNIDPNQQLFILDLLSWVLNNNFLSFDNTTYLQCSGTAMGTPCAPPYANIVLYHMERQILTHSHPIKYFRYLDDIFAIMHSKAQAESFIEAFNSQQPSIIIDTFTIDNSGIFLDMEYFINNNLLQVKIYQKPSNKYLYIPPASAHSKKIIHNFITNEIRRYWIFNSLPLDFLHCKQQFYKRLLKRGYKPHFLRKLFDTQLQTRSTLITSIKNQRLINRNNRTNLRNKQAPITILHLPQINSTNYAPSSIFQLPTDLRNEPLYKDTYSNHTRTLPIIANRLGKNILRLIDIDKFKSNHQEPSTTSNQPLLQPPHSLYNHLQLSTPTNNNSHAYHSPPSSITPPNLFTPPPFVNFTTPPNIQIQFPP